MAASAHEIDLLRRLIPYDMIVNASQPALPILVITLLERLLKSNDSLSLVRVLRRLGLSATVEKRGSIRARL